jgi:hypothetical protein
MEMNKVVLYSEEYVQKMAQMLMGSSGPKVA